jgi:MraZ protein
MIKYSGLDKDALLVGIGNRIEIWNPDIYDDFLANDEEMTSALAEKFLGDWEGLSVEEDVVSEEARNEESAPESLQEGDVDEEAKEGDD